MEIELYKYSISQITIASGVDGLVWSLFLHCPFLVATEIQNIEIGYGDVCHGITIPIYMVFPRLFVCPTLDTTNFKIEFEVNLVVVFLDNQLIMEKFPVKLTRFWS